MVEGARLESVYTGNRIEGSNPSVSASPKFHQGYYFASQMQLKLTCYEKFNITYNFCFAADCFMRLSEQDKSQEK